MTELSFRTCAWCWAKSQSRLWSSCSREKWAERNKETTTFVEDAKTGEGRAIEMSEFSLRFVRIHNVICWRFLKCRGGFGPSHYIWESLLAVREMWGPNKVAVRSNLRPWEWDYNKFALITFSFVLFHPPFFPLVLKKSHPTDNLSIFELKTITLITLRNIWKSKIKVSKRWWIDDDDEFQ